MSTDAIQFAGEFAIEELKIVTPTEQVADLISDVLVIEINIFEDIFSNTLSGNIMLTDIRDIITLLPIQGQEELFLKIKTPSLSDPNDILDFSKNPFVINKVSLRREVTSGGQIYDLSFVSPEAVKNTKKRISKSYARSKANIGEIVDDLMKLDKSGIQTSKEVFVEPTLGTRNYVVPNSNPFTFISKLTKEVNPIDLEGYTARMSIRQSQISTSQLFITLSSSLGPCGTGLNLSGSDGVTSIESGSIGVKISAHSSSLLDFTEAFYDLEISSGSSHPVVTRILEGKVQLSKNVTSGSF